MYDAERGEWEERYEAATRSRRYSCGSERLCGATDCSSCYPNGCDEDEDREETASRVRIRTARKARKVGTSGEIRPGDKVRVVSGFTYRKGGERTGYLPKTYTRIEKGPAWCN